LHFDILEIVNYVGKRGISLVFELIRSDEIATVPVGHHDMDNLKTSAQKYSSKSKPTMAIDQQDT
jgi:hypothetical protein